MPLVFNDAGRHNQIIYTVRPRDPSAKNKISSRIRHEYSRVGTVYAVNRPYPRRGSIVASSSSLRVQKLCTLAVGDDVLTIPQRRGIRAPWRARDPPPPPPPPWSRRQYANALSIAYARLVPRTVNPIYHVRAACASIEILSPGVDIGDAGARVD